MAAHAQIAADHASNDRHNADYGKHALLPPERRIQLIIHTYGHLAEPI
jgi:hypothetical protein